MSRAAVPLVLVSLLLAAAPASAGTTVTFYGGHATMILPDGWEELAPEHIEELSMWFAEATAGRAVAVYQHGYRPPDYQADPWLPHLLVQIRESGRLSYGRYLDLPQAETLESASGDPSSYALPPLVLDVSIDELDFDRDRYCLRLEHTLDLRFKGPVRVFTAAFLTEKGLVALHYVDRERRAEAARARFEAIARSVSFDGELAYRPGLSDRWPGLPFFLAAAATAFATLGYLVARRSHP